MAFQLKEKDIKERCGVVSYKKGESYHRGGKVSIEHWNDTKLKAIVQGVEDFHVELETGATGELDASCTCPSLSSFQQDCQHVAAVLIAIQNKDLRSINSKQSNDMLDLFQDKPQYARREQRYFEKRSVLDVTFFLRVDERDRVRVELSIQSLRIRDIYTFLTAVRDGETYDMAQKFKYDPSKYCFSREVDIVLDELFLIMEDEQMYRGRDGNSNGLIIPPSSWHRILPTLEKISSVTLQYDGNHFIGISQSEDLLPLQFEFKGELSRVLLEIHGLNEIKIMKEYEMILFQGTIIPMERINVGRLEQLRDKLNRSDTNRVAIPTEQFSYYMEKIVPFLKKVGQVHISETIKEKLQHTPLQAKVYLDRLKNRLLIGLEFHYGQVVINPLEEMDRPIGSVFIRNREKEEEILELIEQEGKCIPTESGYYLHNEELEYDFLYHVLPRLEELVQVYATTAVRNRIIRKSWKPKLKVKHRKDRMNWLEFSFEMKGIAESEIKEVLEALEEKRRYYRLKEGTLLSLETREMEEIQRFLRAVPIQDDEFEKELRVPIVEGLRLMDLLGDDSLEYEESFRTFIDEIQHPNLVDVKVPSFLDNVLRNYQKQGYQWLKTLANYGFGGILADDMGLGKTIQSIAYIVSELSQIRERKQPILIICPSAVTYNWLSELMKFAPEVEALVIDGNRSERIELFRERGKTDCIITSYPLLRNDIQMYEKAEFHTVFFDEAQLFKNPLTQTARSVKKIKAIHRFALTGTPIENALEELWSIFHVVFPELFLGLREYSELTKKQIARRIRPFMLRRMKEDVLDELPKKEVTIDRHELLPDQKKLYASYLSKLKHDTYRHLDKDTFRKNRIKILAGLTRLRQICCHPALFVHSYKGSSAKFEQLLNIIDEAKLSGRRVLIFSQFTKMLEMIGKELLRQDTAYFYLDGHTPSEERVALCDRFNQGERNFFLISLKAGGTGLNLTGADTVIFYDSWWNPAVEEQAEDRAHRMGQKKTVEIIKLVAKGTIEDKMYQLQEKKRHLIEEVIDAKDPMLQTLTEDDLLDLLDL